MFSFSLVWCLMCKYLWFSNMDFFKKSLFFSKNMSSQVSALRTLMSISNRLGPFIFRWKIGRMRAMRKEMDGFFFISGLSQHFCFLVLKWKYFSLLYTLTWHVNGYISRQVKGKNRKNKNTKKILFVLMIITNLEILLYWQ